MDTKTDVAARSRAMYDLGKTPVFASKIDPRFHYCLYVPPCVAEGGKADLLVTVHGSSRDSFLEYRNAFMEFGRLNDCIILAPLFPIGPRGDGERHGYKYMEEGDIRYDNVLLGMVDELSAKYGQSRDRFGIFGFSGGGHFAHRFTILHPDRLWAASIGAPGSVTLLDTTRNWWVGVKDIKERFGVHFNPAELAKLPVQMLVGEQDLETWEIIHQPGSSTWMEGANDAGGTRPERLKSLKNSFEKIGVAVAFEVVAGISHERAKVLYLVQDFLTGVLKTRRAS
jgi:hypothetical protein